MSISPSTLMALQKAGESLHAARQAFAQEVQSNAGRVVGIVASEPFSSEADRAYAQLRAVARMAHEFHHNHECYFSSLNVAFWVSMDFSRCLTRT